MQPEEGGAGLVAELHSFAVTGPLGVGQVLLP